MADTVTPGSGAQRLTLHLGVLVQPYAFAGKLVGYQATKAQRQRPASAITTADVAEILEAKYGLFSAFYQAHQASIARAFERSLGGALESLVQSQGQAKTDPWGTATQAIEQQFRDFISTREAERIGIPGTPTLAALMGVNHRLKHPYSSKNPRRPSFRDTGLMMASFRAWVSV